MKDSVRDVRVGVHLETLISDTRYALRGLSKAPAFTAAAVLSLAARHRRQYGQYFTFINALVLRPLPVQHAAALVDVAAEHKAATGDLISNVRDITERQQC